MRNNAVSAQATIIVHRREQPLDQAMASLAGYYGVHCNTFVASSESSVPIHPADFHCVMLSAQTLDAMLDNQAGFAQVIEQLRHATPFLLVYGITERDGVSGACRLTDGLVDSAHRFEGDGHTYNVSANDRELTAELSGLSFGPVRNDVDYGLKLSRPEGSFSAIVSVDGLPMFGRLQRRNSSLFLLACADIADPRINTDCTLSVQRYFSALAPVVMFLRKAFGDRLWRNAKRYASLVIDDPLLQKSYGFLNYSKLLDAMDAAKFASSIAFIPWNYRRTDAGTARLVKERSDRFSICVHGCDHTSGEFAVVDRAELDLSTRLATMRMRDHERNTGIPYADVMVFPQGRFSSVSLSVLNSNNYLAAVNSTVKPVDLGDSHGITLADLLAPAVCRYGSFPLFMRRYPRELADFAFDLFLDKPALLVEHHGYFKNGYDTIRDFATKLNGVCPQLEWTSVGEVITNTYLLRSRGNDDLDCRIFAGRQTIRNTRSAAKTFTVIKAHDEAIPVQHVAVNGRQHPYDIENGELQFTLQIPPSGSAGISITFANTHQNEHTAKKSFKQEVQVYMRRHLSEVRDNYLARHDGLLALAYRVKNGGR